MESKRVEALEDRVEQLETTLIELDQTMRQAVVEMGIHLDKAIENVISDYKEGIMEISLQLIREAKATSSR